MDNEDLYEKGITAISVRGFKSLYDESRIEIRPLTILAGANSSGKSSIMQPLLLLKQRLETAYDPGPLLLDGPNVHFTSAEQILSRVPGRPGVTRFTIEYEVKGVQSLGNTYGKLPNENFALLETVYRFREGTITLRPDMTHAEILSAFDSLPDFKEYLENWATSRSWHWRVTQGEYFLALEGNWEEGRTRGGSFLFSPRMDEFDKPIFQLIHVPAIRINPERGYSATAVGSQLPGTFENYVASVIDKWQLEGDSRSVALDHALKQLRMTTMVKAHRVDATRIELLVGLLPTSPDEKDLVNITDVGSGVSQVLPILVALLIAEEGQLVYLEEPEAHLHPRAQTALAEVIADAAKRGVRVVLETHSSLLLLGVQTLVAEGKLAPELVKLHWFERDPESGITKITSADLDERGAFGEWPEDFADVELKADRRYLDAAIFHPVPH